MLRDTLFRFLRRMPNSAPSVAPSAASTNPGHVLRHHAAPIYPPVDHGIPRVTVEALLDTQVDLLRRLRLATGTSDQNYEQLYGDVVRRLAQTVGLLPATETETHQGAGGLFRLALEMGFYALQSSESAIFAARAGVERRRLLEPRWRYATWLAGICAELYRPVTTMVVTTAEGLQWPAYQEPLDGWLDSVGAERVFVRWIEQKPGKSRAGRGASAAIAQRVIPASSLQFLHAESTEIVPVMLDVITGAYQAHERHPMVQIINDVRERVMARDQAVRPSRYGRLTVGQHAEPHLLDAMRRLFNNGQWALNVRKARLWLGDEGLFLVWPTGAKELLDLLRADGVNGMPQDPQTIVDILTQADVLEEHHEGGPYWTIHPPTANNELAAVKFTDPDILLGAHLGTIASAGVLTRSSAAGTGSVESSAVPDQTAMVTSEPTAPAQCDGAELESAPTAPREAGEAPATKATTPAKAVPKRSAPNHGKADGECDVGANIAERLAKGLDPLARDVFGALVEDLRAGKIVNEAGKVREGFAIGLEQLAGYGVEVAEFAAAVQKAGWLYTSEDKPNKKIYEVQINGKLQRAVIVRMPIAVDLGLIL